MNEVPGFRFSENEAARLVGSLHQCVALLNETVAYADAHCAPDVVLPYKRHIGEIMSLLGWVVLEQGFYKKYPHLRPEGSVLRTEPPT